MSFRGDDLRRYGQVPPVQYPVAGQQPESQNQAQNPQNVGRRPSFNSGDDAAYYGQPQDRTPAFGSAAPPGEDELFMTSPQAQQPSAPARSSFGSVNNAMAGYHHQYQDPTPPTPSHSNYNPQTFAQPTNFQRSQSTNLPYRYSTAPSAYGQSPPSNYTPQTYNPAAYASASPQRQPTYHGYSSQDQGYQQNAPAYGQSPGATYSASFAPSAPSPALSGGYQQSLASPAFSSTSSHGQTQGYDPSQFGSGQYPGQSNGGSPVPAPYPASSSQAPYPTTSQIPVGPNYSSDPSSYYNRPASDTQASPAGSPSAQFRASPGLQRHPTNAPLPNRPMEDVPEEPKWDAYGRPFNDDYANVTQESIMEDIEAELGGGRPLPQPASVNGRYSSDHETLTRFDSNETTLAHSSSKASSNRATYDDDDDDDDPEATAGLLAMRQAELEDRRFSGNTFAYTDMPTVANPLPPPPEEQPQSSDSEVGDTVDLGMLSGGYAGNLTYGNDLGSPPVQSSIHQGSPRRQGYFNGAYDGYDRSPALNNAAMDYGGTGGLQAPTAHRLSFDDGEESVSIHSRRSGTESPTKDEYQDFFYHPGPSANRPLPSIPPGPGSDSSSMLSVQRANSRGQYQHTHSLSADSRPYQAADAPEAYYNAAGQYTQPQPERSISLSGHSNTPQVQAPARSRTDAAEERRKISRQQHVLSQNGPSISEYETGAGAGIGAFDGITLPSGRKRKFLPSKLIAADFERCREPWALSGIEAWVREMTDGELDLRTKTVEDALTHMFTFKVVTMNVADAEALGNRIVTSMLAANVLIPEEEWVKFGNGHISGVLWQLTGSGCYSPRVHDHEMGGRCYSHHCTRTLKKVDLDDLLQENAKPTDEWHIFYGLKKEDWESKPKKEVDRQNILHEIVTGEEYYIKQLDIFRTLYRDSLRTQSPPIIHPDRRDKFLAAVFGKLDTVLRVNKDHLLAQLKYRQTEQGPWIVGFSDLFREWIRKAKSDYIEYATGYPRATYMVRKEAERNVLFKKFLEDKQKHKSSSRQDWTHFLITPLQRLQRYILLLESVDQKMIVDSEEKVNLQKAINEIKVVTMECDAKVEETNKRVQMMELDRMLVLRPGFQSVLNLDHLGRQLIIQGDLQRMGSKGVRWVDTHALLFDHYLILGKEVVPKDGRGEKKYDVSREVSYDRRSEDHMLTGLADSNAAVVLGEYERRADHEAEGHHCSSRPNDGCISIGDAAEQGCEQRQQSPRAGTCSYELIHQLRVSPHARRE